MTGDATPSRLMRSFGKKLGLQKSNNLYLINFYFINKYRIKISSISYIFYLNFFMFLTSFKFRMIIHI